MRSVDNPFPSCDASRLSSPSAVLRLSSDSGNAACYRSSERSHVATGAAWTQKSSSARTRPCGGHPPRNQPTVVGRHRQLCRRVVRDVAPHEPASDPATPGWDRGLSTRSPAPSPKRSVMLRGTVRVGVTQRGKTTWCVLRFGGSCSALGTGNADSRLLQPRCDVTTRTCAVALLDPAMSQSAPAQHSLGTSGH